MSEEKRKKNQEDKEDVISEANQASPPNKTEEDGSTDCESLRDEYLKGWQRAKADLINYRREEGQRFDEFAKYQEEKIILEFISVLDTLNIGIAAMENRGNADEGIYLIRSQMEDLLKKHGVERIPVKKGDEFDPCVHEAITETISEVPEGHIVEEMGAGYRQRGKIIRAAKVITSKNQE